MCHGFCALGAVAPSSDFLVHSGPFVSSVIFFLHPEFLSVCQEGDGRESGQKCYFSEYAGDAV